MSVGDCAPYANGAAASSWSTRGVPKRRARPMNGLQSVPEEMRRSSSPWCKRLSTKEKSTSIASTKWLVAGLRSASGSSPSRLNALQRALALTPRPFDDLPANLPTRRPASFIPASAHATTASPPLLLGPPIFSILSRAGWARLGAPCSPRLLSTSPRCRLTSTMAMGAGAAACANFLRLSVSYRPACWRKKSRRAAPVRSRR